MPLSSLDYREILGAVAAIIGVVGFLPYFSNLFAGRTKPHAFSWLIWGILSAITFTAQIVSGTGPGAWIIGVAATLSLAVFFIAIFRGEKEITTLDEISLISAALGIVLWIATTNPLWSVVIVSIVDAVGYVPTFRKTYRQPYGETLTLYLGTVSFVISLFALQIVDLTTALYTTSLIATNIIFISMVLLRRRKGRSTVASFQPNRTRLLTMARAGAETYGALRLAEKAGLEWIFAAPAHLAVLGDFIALKGVNKRQSSSGLKISDPYQREK